MSTLHKAFGQTLGPLGFPVTDTEARELEKHLESGEWEKFALSKSDSFESLLPGERSDISVITDPSVDRVGDVVDPDSLDFAKYQKNPVVAWDHNYEMAPIGKSLWQKKLAGGIWKAKTQYLERPTSLPEKTEWVPDTIFSMMQQGSLKGKSVGGAVKWREPTQEDADRLKFDLKSCKRISEKAIVYEYSVCAQACNPKAMVEQISKGYFQLGNLAKSFPEVVELLEKAEKQDAPIIIDSFKSSDQLKYEQQLELKKRINIMILESDNLIDDILKRKMGRVE